MSLHPRDRDGTARPEASAVPRHPPDQLPTRCEIFRRARTPEKCHTHGIWTCLMNTDMFLDQLSRWITFQAGSQIELKHVHNGCWMICWTFQDHISPLNKCIEMLSSQHHKSKYSSWNMDIGDICIYNIPLVLGLLTTGRKTRGAIWNMYTKTWIPLVLAESDSVAQGRHTNTCVWRGR